MRPSSSPKRAAGFGAIAAIVVLVILASLAAFLATVSNLQQHSSTLDLLGSRALQAARAGIEWGAYKVYNPENTLSPTPYACSVTPVSLSGLAGTLAEFTVTVQCSSTMYTESGNTVRVYQVAATACNIPDGGACPNTSSTNTNTSYVERQISTVMATCRLPSLAPC